MLRNDLIHSIVVEFRSLIRSIEIVNYFTKYLLEVPDIRVMTVYQFRSDGAYHRLIDDLG